MPTVDGWRRVLAALLVIVTALAGAGRAAASAADPAELVAGFHAPICHSGPDRVPADPAGPTPHDCCDGCALMNPAVLPAPPSVAEPFAPAAAAERGEAVVRSLSLVRQRGPRQAQAPPRG